LREAQSNNALPLRSHGRGKGFESPQLHHSCLPAGRRLGAFGASLTVRLTAFAHGPSISF